MTRAIAILGRQPALGIAELESLYGADKLQPLSGQAALLEMPPSNVYFPRLGGTIKLARLLTVIGTTNWQKLEDYFVEHLPQHVCCIPEGRLTLGLSVYGLEVSAKRVNATGLTLKKIVRASGRPCRLVPNNEPALSSAQALHNRLFTDHNWELVLIGAGEKTYLAQTTNVQDIEAYAARDRVRPKRDTRIGMLPPKLAQIIINLAVGKLKVQNSYGLDATHGNQKEGASRTNGVESKRQMPVDTAMRQENQWVTSSAHKQADSAIVVLDPFCGTGIINQEAFLAGYNTYGTDIEPRMVQFAKDNMDWFVNKSRFKSILNDEDYKELSYYFDAADATNFIWKYLPDTIACETYLGRPFSSQPKPKVLREVMQDVDTIHKKFLRNVARQTKSGFRLCLAVPAWHIPTSEIRNQKSEFMHLPMLENLRSLGYTRTSFVHVRDEELIYHREGQIVGRELIVLQRT